MVLSISKMVKNMIRPQTVIHKMNNKTNQPVCRICRKPIVIDRYNIDYVILWGVFYHPDCARLEFELQKPFNIKQIHSKR